MLLNREPVAIAAAVRAVLLASMAFGFDLSAEQLAAVMLAVEAVLALITRSQVTPVASGSRFGDTGSARMLVLVGLALALTLTLAAPAFDSGPARAPQPVSHLHGWSVANGGDATVKVRQEDDGRYRFIVTDGVGRVLARGPADGFATQAQAQDHAEKLVGGYWHPVIAP